VPVAIKDEFDVAGQMTTFGTAARTRAAVSDADLVRRLRAAGAVIIGKTNMPEFGAFPFTESTAYGITRNPWDLGTTPGGSSGGSAAAVAAGLVSAAMGGDGGGSIRIPAAAAGLIGLKPSRGRHVNGETARHLPINMISEGVLTRSVRDTAVFFAAAEDYWRNPKLPPVGLVQGPSKRRLRIGLVLDSVTAAQICPHTRAAVERTAALLEKEGHHIEPMPAPVDAQFAADFVLYWGLLATLTAKLGKHAFDRSFDTSKLDGLTLGLGHHYRRHLRDTPGALYRLRRATHAYARMFERRELVLSPVLAHVTPPLGHLSPTVPYPELIARLNNYVAYTPINNITGTPAISLPMAQTPDGLPIGVHLSAAYGDERTLLETAFALEQQQDWPRIQH
jgi:amidase